MTDRERDDAPEGAGSLASERAEPSEPVESADGAVDAGPQRASQGGPPEPVAEINGASEPEPQGEGATVEPPVGESAREAAPDELAPAHEQEPAMVGGGQADLPEPVSAPMAEGEGTEHDATAHPSGSGGIQLPVISRRTFLAAGAAVACGAAGAFALAQVYPLPPGRDDSPVVAKEPAWTFVADTNKCIGCGLCVAACKAENNVTTTPEFARTWIERHLVAADGAVYVDSPEGGIHGFPRESEAPGAAEASVVDAFFEPRLCMQCAEPPCTSVCPVGATYRTAEGVVLVDANRCIGCGYCVVSCPYGARYLVPASDKSPTGIVGVADKCTWCYHRITVGRVPACVEVCPVGAREFGDLADPTSPIHDVLKGKETHQLHPEFGTKPVVLYVGSTNDGKEPA